MGTGIVELVSPFVKQNQAQRSCVVVFHFNIKLNVSLNLNKNCTIKYAFSC